MLWHFVMYRCCITAGYDSFPLAPEIMIGCLVDESARNVFTAFKWLGNDLLTYCAAGSCLSRFGRAAVLSRQTSNGALSISVTKQERYKYVCVCVCVCDRGWLDIHVALIIVPLLPGSHRGVGQALMWVWSHVTLGCWAEVAYWCRHHIVTHISYQARLFEMKAAIYVCVCVCMCVCVGVCVGVFT